MKSVQWVVLAMLSLSSALVDAREPSRSRDADYGSQGGSEAKEESRESGRGGREGGRDGGRSSREESPRRESPQVFQAQPMPERSSFNPGRTGGW
jgi:hypothetical protein